jgi:hypothetical protein
MCATQLEVSCVSLVNRSSTRRAPRLWQRCLGVAVAGLASLLCQRAASAQAHAHAQDEGLPKALLFATIVQRGRPLPELDRQIRKAIVEHAPVQLLDGAPKRLSALQASTHCRDESVACLRAVAQLARVEVLLAATLERGASDFTLNLVAFDARADAVTRVAHWQDGSEVTAETYAALPSLLGALFPEPGPPDMDFVAEAKSRDLKPAATAAPSLALRDVPRKRSLLAPVLAASGGALILGAGIVTGLILSSTQGNYDSKDVRTRSDAEAADSLRSRGSTEASVANVFYGLGSVVLVASGAWLAIELWKRSDSSSERAATQLSPWLAPRQVGLVLRHQGGLF